MRIIVLYCAPCVNQPVYGPAAQRFTRSYIENPPGIEDHELVIGLNGTDTKSLIHERLFHPLQPQYFFHNNWGRDLGLFQSAADKLDCDLMIFCGALIRFPRPGWLDWILKQYLDNGPALYGAFGFHQPRHHLRTTCFWCAPELIRCYPYQISDSQRYAAEHGPESFTLWAQSKGFETLMVTWRGTFRPEQWRHVERDEAIVFDQHTDRIGY